MTAKMYRPARLVRIVQVGDTWKVVYVHRRKNQKVAAASFYVSDHSLASVEQWVLNNPRLELQVG